MEEGAPLLVPTLRLSKSGEQMRWANDEKLSEMADATVPGPSKRGFFWVGGF